MHPVNVLEALPVQYLVLTSARGGRGQVGGSLGEKAAEGRRRRGGAGFPRWREVGEKEDKYATLFNILQSKRRKDAGANKIPGIRCTRLKLKLTNQSSVRGAN